MSDTPTQIHSSLKYFCIGFFLFSFFFCFFFFCLQTRYLCLIHQQAEWPLTSSSLRYHCAVTFFFCFTFVIFYLSAKKIFQPDTSINGVGIDTFFSLAHMLSTIT